MDNTGKDTQIKRILNRYNREVFHTLHYHAVKNRDNTLARLLAQDTYDDMMFIMEEMTNINFVLNRSHYGEYVYGKLYRDYEDPEYIFRLEQRYPRRARMMVEQAVLIVLVNSDYKTLAAREDGDSLSQGQIDQIIHEHNRFIQVHDMSIIPAPHKIIINAAGKSKDDVAEEVAEFLDTVYAR